MSEVRMLFRRQHPPRLSQAEIEAVRHRAKGFVAGFGKRDFTLTDLFTLAFSGEAVPGSSQRNLAQDEDLAVAAATEPPVASATTKANSSGRSTAQKQRQPRHNKSAKYAGSEIRV